jgi:hypothetical protein
MILSKKEKTIIAFSSISLFNSFSMAHAEVLNASIFDSFDNLYYNNYIEEKDYQTIQQYKSKQLTKGERENLSNIVAKILQSADDKIKERNISSEIDLTYKYANIQEQIIIDTAQLKIAKEQLKNLTNNYEKAKHKAAVKTEKLVRHSIDGTSRLEIMTPLKNDATKAQNELKIATRRYLDAKQNVTKKEANLQALKEKQKDIELQLNSLSLETNETSSTKNVLVQNTSTQNVSTRKSDTNAEVQNDLSKLRAEFLSELQKNGYIEDETAVNTLDAPFSSTPMEDERFKLDGTIRIDSLTNRGDIHNDRARLRLRLYPDYNIDGNWHIKGMAEAEKATDKDATFKLDRYFLEGNIGEAHTIAGVYSSNLAEGNIYDSKFTGLNISTGTKTKYTFQYGKANSANDVNLYSATVEHKTPDYSILGGYHYFDIDGGKKIFELTAHKPLNGFDLGLTYLYGKDNSPKHNGFIASITHNKQINYDRSFISWLKYYYQPSSTYVSHTMNGTADYMSYRNHSSKYGFRGFSAGFNYSITKDLIFSAEYYNLYGLGKKEHNQTLWLALEYFFKNY